MSREPFAFARFNARGSSPDSTEAMAWSSTGSTPWCPAAAARQLMTSCPAAGMFFESTGALAPACEAARQAARPRSHAQPVRGADAASLGMVAAIDGVRASLGARIADMEHPRCSADTLADANATVGRTVDRAIEAAADRHASGFAHASRAGNAARYASLHIDAAALKKNVGALHGNTHKGLHAALALRRDQLRARHQISFHACHDIPGQL